MKVALERVVGFLGNFSGFSQLGCHGDGFPRRKCWLRSKIPPKNLQESPRISKNLQESSRIAGERSRPYETATWQSKKRRKKSINSRIINQHLIRLERNRERNRFNDIPPENRCGGEGRRAGVEMYWRPKKLKWALMHRNHPEIALKSPCNSTGNQMDG